MMVRNFKTSFLALLLLGSGVVTGRYLGRSPETPLDRASRWVEGAKVSASVPALDTPHAKMLAMSAAQGYWGDPASYRMIAEADVATLRVLLEEVSGVESSGTHHVSTTSAFLGIRALGGAGS